MGGDLSEGVGLRRGEGGAKKVWGNEVVMVTEVH